MSLDLMKERPDGNDIILTVLTAVMEELTAMARTLTAMRERINWLIMI